MVPVPVALKDLGRIVAPLGSEKLRHPGVAPEYLLSGGVTVVREVIAPAQIRCGIDQPSERGGGPLDPLLGVRCPDVEDDAGVVARRPCQDTGGSG